MTARGMLRAATLTVVCTIVGVACGDKDAKDEDAHGGEHASDGQPVELRGEPVAGNVGGKAWTVGGGYATPDRRSSGRLEIHLWSKASGDPCDPLAGRSVDGTYVSFTVSATTGTTTFPTAANEFLSFGVGSEGHTSIALGTGRATINAISAQVVSGSVIGRADTQNEVNGTFSVPYCASRGPTFPPQDEGDDEETPPGFDVDPEVVGEWRADYQVIFPVRVEVSVREPEQDRVRVLLGGVSPEEDFEETIAYDLSATPKRMTRTTSVVHATYENNPRQVGDKALCIYEVRGGEVRELHMQCGEAEFPAAFGEGHEVYREVRGA